MRWSFGPELISPSHAPDADYWLFICKDIFSWIYRLSKWFWGGLKLTSMGYIATMMLLVGAAICHPSEKIVNRGSSSSCGLLKVFIKRNLWGKSVLGNFSKIPGTCGCQNVFWGYNFQPSKRRPTQRSSKNRGSSKGSEVGSTQDAG